MLEETATVIQRLEDATVLQDGMFYSEPSYWYFPVRQMLGAALLMDGQAQLLPCSSSNCMHHR